MKPMTNSCRKKFLVDVSQSLTSQSMKNEFSFLKPLKNSQYDNIIKVREAYRTEVAQKVVKRRDEEIEARKDKIAEQSLNRLLEFFFFSL